MASGSLNPALHLQFPLVSAGVAAVFQPTSLWRVSSHEVQAVASAALSASLQVACLVVLISVHLSEAASKLGLQAVHLSAATLQVKQLASAQAVAQVSEV